MGPVYRGIIDYIATRKDSTDTIMLQLTEGLSLKARQKLFADIGNNVSKPVTVKRVVSADRSGVNTTTAAREGGSVSNHLPLVSALPGMMRDLIIQFSTS